MKIVNVHIYGYGKWKDQSWELSEDGVQLFFGENESGKSTFMSFIKAILFGFPKKSDNQYIPVDTDSYGGTIKLLSEQFGEVVVERVKGRKVSGEVTVYFHDGTSGGEEELAKVLDDIDQTTFQGIFHFDLDGLNGIDKMTPEELNQFLYDTGLGGGQSISAIEKKINVDMEKLYKPRGKKTEMNLLLKEMEGKERDIHQWEERIDRYEELTSLIKQKEENIKDNKNQQAVLQERIKKMEKYEMIVPLAKAWEEKRLQLLEEKEIQDFPENGLERMDRFEERLLEKKSNLRDGKVKEKLLREKYEALTEHSPDIIHRAKEYISEYELYSHRQKELNDFRVEKDHLTKRMESMERDWNGSSIVSFMEIPFQPFMKNKLYHIKERDLVENQEERAVQRDLERVNKNINELMGQIKENNLDLLADEEILQLEEKLSKVKGKQQLLDEKATLVEQLQYMQKQHRIMRQRDKQTEYIFFILTIVFTGLAIFVLPEIILALSIVLLSILSCGMGIQKRLASKKWDKEMKRDASILKEKIKKIEDIISSNNMEEGEQLNKILFYQREKQLNQQQLKYQLGELYIKKGNLEEDLEIIRKNRGEISIELSEWCTQFSLPQDEDYLYYEGLLDTLEEWNKIHEQREQIQAKMDRMERIQHEFSNKVKELIRELKPTILEDQTLQRSIELLIQFLNEVERTERRRSSVQEQISNCKETISKFQVEIEDIMGEMEELLRKAAVSSLEDYRKKGAANERYQRLQGEYKQLWLQMKLIIRNEEELSQTVPLLLDGELKPIYELSNLKGQLIELDTANEETYKDLAAIKKELSVLVEDGTYEEVLQEFTQMKEELNSLGKKWAVLSISKHIIQEVKRMYEQEKQPAVIKEAEVLFSSMTNGEYRKLFAPLGEERFILERHDGVRFDPAQLSRGTCELLYLAFRFALAKKFPKKEAFPLVMDEALVNIDRSRRKQVLKLVEDISQYRQVLFFTCHNHIRKEMNGNLLTLPESGVLPRL
ncbi:uncharacterized protein YhaN [Evansella vedderi]|uniref:Uncharacterized protein YhaN n=1 Tax=Evansella vedderi TaxID=38282 RepID=A0ABT9ZSK4_9BACI|nr:AAA family ATPase [Evansella vedderi]MDQ0254207.1 uncharacterized protein YhaN [Evansella vedderi]